MDSNRGPETRRRSRSKTPFVLRSQCNKESCTDADHGHAPAIKIPDVITIMEEDAVETPSKVRTSSRTSRKIVGSGTSEAVAESSQQTVTTTTTVVHQSSSSTKTSHQSSKETAQNAQNASLENKTITETNKSMTTSTPIQSASRKNLHTTASTITSPIASPVFESADDHAAYREYRNAGEYWNKYPKTDYTYSKLSPHRRELAPGMVAMPNMSRRSLEKHHDRVNLMAQANPEFESYIRKRYETRQYTAQNRAKFNAMYDSQDSQDEVDVVGGYQNGRKSTTTTTTTSIFKRIIVVRWITTLVSWLYESSSGVFSGQHQSTNVYNNRLRDERGWLKRLLSSMSTRILSIFTTIYLTISSVLFLDSWLLKSKTQGTGKKRFLLFLLMLLPILLLAAWRLQDPPSTIPTFSGLPSISLGMPSFLTTPFTFYKDDSNQNSFLSAEQYASSASSSHSHATPQSAPTFNEEQYEALLQQLNRYIDTIVTQKFSTSEQALSSIVITNIANTMHEHITKHEFVLSAADADRVAELVRAELAADQKATSKETPTVLSNEHITLVSKLINERVVLENQQRSPEIDIDAIIGQVLASPNLLNIIDARVVQQTRSDSLQIQEQTRLIDALRDEIEAIKLKLDKNSDVQHHVDQTLMLLQTHYENLGNQFDAFKRDNEERFASLLQDVNFNISKSGEHQFAGIDNRIKVLLLDVFGFKNKANETPDDVDLRGWIHSVFVAKDMLEERLQAIQVDNDVRLKAEIDRSAEIMMGDIGSRIRAQSIELIEANQAKLKDSNLNVEYQSKRELDEEEIKRIVAEAIAVYDADKTGLVDYALESAGGEIVSTRCTETYHTKTAQISVFGVPLWYPTNTPRTAISPTVQPGQCWAFQGFPGFLVLKLNTLIHVTGFTIEHIPKSLSPNGHIDSAPKTFTVWGLESENDHEPIQFGTYEFAENGSNLQYFPVQTEDIKRLHNIVELRIESNHGNIHYTCLYRFRVHGTPTRG